MILPGHDDRHPAKTRKLIEAALRQAGIAHACQYEWSTHGRFRNSISAHKCRSHGRDNVKKWQFENAKEYLRTKTWVHLALHFEDETQVPGPLVIGAGRHCGFGLMAGVDV